MAIATGTFTMEKLHHGFGAQIGSVDLRRPLDDGARRGADDMGGVDRIVVGPTST